MKWFNCNTCAEEFRVISETIEDVAYCPFCGDDIVEEESEEDEVEY